MLHGRVKDYESKGQSLSDAALSLSYLTCVFFRPNVD